MQCFCDGEIIDIHNKCIATYGAVPDYRIRVTDDERTEKNTKIVKVMKVVSVAMRVLAERVRGA